MLAIPRPNSNKVIFPHCIASTLEVSPLFPVVRLSSWQMAVAALKNLKPTGSAATGCLFFWIQQIHLRGTLNAIYACKSWVVGRRGNYSLLCIPNTCNQGKYDHSDSRTNQDKWEMLFVWLLDYNSQNILDSMVTGDTSGGHSGICNFKLFPLLH